MENTKNHSIHLHSCLLALVALFTIGVYFSLSQNYINDDGFIHARISRNLVEYGRAYFNLDSPVNASSSPLFTILIAALFLIFGPHLWVVQLWNALMVLLFVALVWQRFPAASWIRAIVALVGMFSLLPAASDLMETPTALLLLSAGVFSLAARPAIGLALLTLAVFTRPECGVMLLLGLVWVAYQRKESLVRPLVGIALVALPLLGWLHFQFGSFIPQSILAKSIVYQISPRVFWEHFSLSLFADEDRVTWALGIAMLLALCLVLRRKELPRGLAIVLGVGVLLTVLAYRGKLVLFFPWYAPLVTVPTLFLLGLVAGVAGKQRFVSLACVAMMFVFAWPLALELKELLNGTSNSAAMKWGARVQSYRLIGATLQEKFPTSVILMAEIGGLGWEFRGKVLDGAGLATPEALEFHPMSVPKERVSGSIGAIPLGFIELAQPDFVVGYPQFLKEFAASARASQDYCQYDLAVFPERERARMQSAALWGNRHLFVYAKRSTIGYPLWSACPWPNELFGDEFVDALVPRG